MELMLRLILALLAVVAIVAADQSLYHRRAERAWLEEARGDELEYRRREQAVELGRELAHGFRVRWGRVATVLLAGLCLAAPFGRRSYWAELASHFRVQYMLAAIGLTLFLLAHRDFGWAAGAGALAASQGAPVLPWYFGRPRAGGGTRARLLFANISNSNSRADLVLALAREADADFIVVQELTAHWQGLLAPLRLGWPHYEEHPHDEAGVAIYSRRPLAGVELGVIGEESMPVLTARVELGGCMLTLASAHAAAPFKPENHSRRARQLAGVGQWLAGLKAGGDGLLFVGDLNLTMWSPLWREVAAAAGLRNARRGFGILATWPAQIPPARIPIDHCLASPGVRVTGLWRGRPTGSDHLPLVVDFEHGRD